MSPVPASGRKVEGMNLGLRVRLIRNYGGRIFQTILRNVTEIHHNHNQEIPSVAFESDIHGTGINERLSAVVEFEATLETELAEGF